MWEFVFSTWSLILAAVSTLLSIFASAHAVLYKRDTRAVIGWVGLIWFAPLVGSLLYFVFGINRIRRRGEEVGKRFESHDTHLRAALQPSTRLIDDAARHYPQYYQLALLVGELTGQPLLLGNRVDPLTTGQAAYARMLEAIDNAERSIALCSYIFDNDRAGHEFLDALVRAKARGVAVRVLIDDVGASYTRPTMLSLLEARDVTGAAFLPSRVPRLFHYANLRNHRKILVVDGAIGFTGGMNIREGCRLDWDTAHPIQDVHFCLEGPVVNDMQRAFAIDWAFTTGEMLDDDRWFAEGKDVGDVLARGIAHGPDEGFDRLRLAILGALAVAQRRIQIVTPYFLPDAALIVALNVAAMRGVDVRIVLPGRNNIRLVQWAATAQYWQLLERGCRIWHTPPPFDHTKILLVDDAWSLIGSANWDPRSLRLNFEFNVECYHIGLNEQLARIAETKIGLAHEVTLNDVERRGYPRKLRDGAARLLSPFI